MESFHRTTHLLSVRDVMARYGIAAQAARREMDATKASFVAGRRLLVPESALVAQEERRAAERALEREGHVVRGTSRPRGAGERSSSGRSQRELPPDFWRQTACH